LGAADEERIIAFRNPTCSNTLRIDVPAPVSPKELGLSSDDRSLGIGFIGMKITPF
jgi:hypothetical protein